jgi:hypothetical protein
LLLRRLDREKRKIIIPMPIMVVKGLVRSAKYEARNIKIIKARWMITSK